MFKHNPKEQTVLSKWLIIKIFMQFASTGNRMLLWHGSRLSNWTGILSQGLRIAPPEAPVTGYMFGKGVYFADMFSKSANYCYASEASRSGVLLLCEVCLLPYLPLS
jgi:poly [ADP-ribose] polymerase